MSAHEHPVIYLTGGPASGKSTTVRALVDAVPTMKRFDWGAEACAAISMRLGRQIAYDELRADSATLITRQDVVALDERLIAWVQEVRGTSPVVIDTHAVTRESFGFRTTPFSDDQWRRLRATHLFALYASPGTIGRRLETDPAGRLASDAFHVTLHAALQGAVATTYAILAGLPLYTLCTDEGSAIEIAQRIATISGLTAVLHAPVAAP